MRYQDYQLERDDYPDYGSTGSGSTGSGSTGSTGSGSTGGGSTGSTGSTSSTPTTRGTQNILTLGDAYRSFMGKRKGYDENDDENDLLAFQMPVAASSSNTGVLVLVALVAIGGAIYYFHTKRGASNV